MHSHHHGLTAAPLHVVLAYVLVTLLDQDVRPLLGGIRCVVHVSWARQNLAVDVVVAVFLKRYSYLVVIHLEFLDGLEFLVEERIFNHFQNLELLAGATDRDRARTVPLRSNEQVFLHLKFVYGIPPLLPHLILYGLPRNAILHCQELRIDRLSLFINLVHLHLRFLVQAQHGLLQQLLVPLSSIFVIQLLNREYWSTTVLVVGLLLLLLLDWLSRQGRVLGRRMRMSLGLEGGGMSSEVVGHGVTGQLAVKRRHATTKGTEVWWYEWHHARRLTNQIASLIVVGHHREPGMHAMHEW